MKQFFKALFVLFLLLYALHHAHARSISNQFLIAPYVLDVDRVSATIAFHLEQSMNAKVLVYDNDTVTSFVSDKKSTSHFIKISGLQPGYTYTYQVICGSGIVKTPPHDSSYQIRTACNKGESFSCIVFGDPRPGENRTNKHHQQVIERAIQNEPAFCLVLGDMVDDGTDIELWKDFFSIEKELLRKVPLYPVIGDNDFMQGRGLVKDFFPFLEHGYYHFEWGDVHFFGMNAWDSRGFQSKSELDAESEQLQWLTSQLSQENVQKSLFRVVFLHDPVRISRGYAAEILKRAWEPVFLKYNVDCVFASWHLYERSQCNGIRYIISGGGGAELLWMNKNPDYSSQAEARKYHFCKVDVNAGAMTISAIDIHDTVLDSFTVSPRKKTSRDNHRLQSIAEKVRQKIVIEEGENRPLMPLHLFSYGDCSYCKKLVNTIFPRLAKRYHISLNVYFYDLELHENVYDLLLSVGADFGNQHSDIPTLFLGNQVYGGEQEIENNLERELRNFSQQPEEYSHNSIVPFHNTCDTKTIKETSFDALSSRAVITTGLLDSANSCVFTTLSFLIAFLIFFGADRWKSLLSGLVFIIAMLFTCTLVGLFFYQGAFLISGLSRIASVIKLSMALGIAVLAAISMRSVLSAPGASRPSFTRLFWNNIRQRFSVFVNHCVMIIPVAALLGFFIAAGDLSCVGQLYIPIVSMIPVPLYRAKAVAYLLLYNLAFISPVAGMYVLVLLGIIVRELVCVNVKAEKS
ncbi:MAG: metallophosphoesterase [bacterium]